MYVMSQFIMRFVCVSFHSVSWFSWLELSHPVPSRCCRVMAGRRPIAGAKAKSAAAPRQTAGRANDPASDDDTTPRLSLPEGGEVESSPDRDGPELDMSRNTAIQGRTFRTFFNELTPAIQMEWNQLMQPGGPRVGKQKRKYEIINFAVPRNNPTTIDPKARNLNKSVFSRRREVNAKNDIGLTRTEMRSKFGDALFKEGLADGDIIENKEENLFYMRSSVKRIKRAVGKDKAASLEYTHDDTQAWAGAVCAMMNECSDWQTEARNSGGAASSRDNSPASQMFADDALFAKLQQTFDVAQRLRENVMKRGQDLIKVTTLTDEGAQMLQRGVALSKTLMEAVSNIQVMLFTPRLLIPRAQAVEALSAACAPLVAMDVYNCELMSLHAERR